MRGPADHVARIRVYGSQPHRTFIVVPAKAGTHYSKSRSLRDAGANVPPIIRCGGYGSRPSPGRQRSLPNNRATLPRPSVAGILDQIAVRGLLADVVLLVVAMAPGGVERNAWCAAGALVALVVVGNGPDRRGLRFRHHRLRYAWRQRRRCGRRSRNVTPRIRRCSITADPKACDPTACPAARAAPAAAVAGGPAPWRGDGRRGSRRQRRARRDGRHNGRRRRRPPRP